MSDITEEAWGHVLITSWNLNAFVRRALHQKLLDMDFGSNLFPNDSKALF